MDKLGLRELLRYGYTGVLCAFVAVVIDGTKTEQLIRYLGEVLAPLCALAIGTIVYLVFKTMVGDLFLWRLINELHASVERLLKRPATRCKVRFLEEQCNVKKGQGLDAYALVRDSLLLDTVQERFHIQHSEGYLLFVTAFVCGIVSLSGLAGVLPIGASHAKVISLGVVAIIAFVAGLWHDIILCRAERAALGSLSREKLQDVLAGGGFSK